MALETAATELVLTGVTLVDAISEMSSASTRSNNYNREATALKMNAKAEEYAAEMAYQEGSLSESMTRLQGRENISSGVAAMSAFGNIGTSAQSAIREGAFNLDKDLAAIRYKYYNEAIQHKNQAKIYRYNADTLKENAKDAKLSGFLGVATAIGSGALTGYRLGL